MAFCIKLHWCRGELSWKLIDDGVTKDEMYMLRHLEKSEKIINSISQEVFYFKTPIAGFKYYFLPRFCPKSNIICYLNPSIVDKEM